MTKNLTLLTYPSTVCEPGPDGHCAICSDEGIPGQVLEIRPNNLALVELPSGQLEIALDLLDNVQIGDQLLIHAGVAIATLENENNVF